MVLNAGIFILRLLYKILAKTKLGELSFRKLSLTEILSYITFRFLKKMAVEQCITLEGHKYFYPCPTPAIIILSGEYEPHTTDLFKTLLRPGMRVIDAGSCVGYYSLLAAKLVGPTGKVFAFEPNLRNLECLFRNIELNGYHNIICEEKAISNRNGLKRLFLSKEIGSHTFFSDGQKGNHVLVETTSLDEYFKGEKQIDLIKMDIEGAEFDALDGMEGLLEKHDIKLIIEFAPSRLIAAGRNPDDFIYRLWEMRFSVLMIGERGIFPFNRESRLISQLVQAKSGAVNLYCYRL